MHLSYPLLYEQRSQECQVLSGGCIQNARRGTLQSHARTSAKVAKALLHRRSGPSVKAACAFAGYLVWLGKHPGPESKDYDGSTKR
jgi:hypothetical protein